MRAKNLVRGPNRRGITLALVGVLMLGLLGMAALAVDVGYAYAVHSRLQATADSAALAGASGLSTSITEAKRRVKEYVQKNPVFGTQVLLADTDVQLGSWDSTGRIFTPMSAAPGSRAQAVRVTPRLAKALGTAVNLFFGGAVGYRSVDVGTSATATYAACDFVVVLDFSGSMCYDSQLGRAGQYGITLNSVVQNMQLMYSQLGSPVYGKMQFDQYISSSTASTVLNTLGLKNVPYPYPAGSWNDYIDYVMNDKSTNFSQPLTKAGKLKHYGYLTLINYWQDNYAQANQTPDLWKTSEQPVSAVKDGLSVFLAYTQQTAADNRVALVLFTYSDSKAIVEQHLTSDYNLIQTTANQRQAAHYNPYTNTSAGLAAAIKELQTNGRTGVYPVIVLLSDGQANTLDNGTHNVNQATSAALAQASTAAAANIPIVPISLGADADLPFMQQLADISQKTPTGKGIHFIINAGQSVDQYRTQLMDVFAQLALQMPLRLVD